MLEIQNVRTLEMRLSVRFLTFSSVPAAVSNKWRHRLWRSTSQTCTCSWLSLFYLTFWSPLVGVGWIRFPFFLWLIISRSQIFLKSRETMTTPETRTGAITDLMIQTVNWRSSTFQDIFNQQWSWLGLWVNVYLCVLFPRCVSMIHKWKTLISVTSHLHMCCFYIVVDLYLQRVGLCPSCTARFQMLAAGSAVGASCHVMSSV